MAGSGARFTQAGFETPKYKIVANGKPLLEWALLSLNCFFDCQFIFISRKEIWDKDFVASTTQKLGIKESKVVLADSPTEGQASTVMLAAPYLNPKDPICIYNIDTHIHPNKIEATQFPPSEKGHIPYFQVEGNHWSFLKQDKHGNVVQVAEKIPISNKATIGLYYFSSWLRFSEIYYNHKEEIKKKYRETYVAPMYQFLIDQGHKVGATELQPNDVIALGTPEEVSVFDRHFRKNNQ